MPGLGFPRSTRCASSIASTGSKKPVLERAGVRVWAYPSLATSPAPKEGNSSQEAQKAGPTLRSGCPKTKAELPDVPRAFGYYEQLACCRLGDSVYMRIGREKDCKRQLGRVRWKPAAKVGRRTVHSGYGSWWCGRPVPPIARLPGRSLAT